MHIIAENGVSLVFPGSSDGLGHEGGGIEWGHKGAGIEQGHEGAGIEQGHEGAGIEQGPEGAGIEQDCGTLEMDEEDIRTQPHSDDTPLSLGTQVRHICVVWRRLPYHHNFVYAKMHKHASNMASCHSYKQRTSITLLTCVCQLLPEHDHESLTCTHMCYALPSLRACVEECDRQTVCECGRQNECCMCEL